MQSHDSLVKSQFGPHAANYLASAVHASGEDLQQLVATVRAQPGGKVLDLGCGGGHVSFQVAPHAGSVIAYDLSADMLEAVADEARRRNLPNITTERGAAEKLPFTKDTFDFVFTRYSAHHWRDVPTALKEIRRVLKPNGSAILVDSVAPASPLLDTFLQTMEMLRDPSHVRDYSVEEWRRMATAAGLIPGQVTRRKIHLEFAAWVERIGTPELHVQAIRALQGAVSEDVVRYFAVAPDGSFDLDNMSLEVRCG